MKFRYPKFQKVMWYSVINCLKKDPLPESVREAIYSGEKFHREIPTWLEFETHGHASNEGAENYHARYYSQMELDGLPELANYIFRTVMISMDRIEGVTVETRRNVAASIPKGYGDPLELAKTFALWVAWKRGNEDPPAWAHPDFGLPDKEGVEPKKLSTKMMKQKQRQEAFEAYKLAPERQSSRRKLLENTKQIGQPESSENSPSTPTIIVPSHRGSLGPRRVACDACRKRRIRCKHKDEGMVVPASDQKPVIAESSAQSANRRPSREFVGVVIPRMSPTQVKSTPSAKKPMPPTAPEGYPNPVPFTPGTTSINTPSVHPYATPQVFTPDLSALSINQTPDTGADHSTKRGRNKACAECRKSKVSSEMKEVR